MLKARKANRVIRIPDEKKDAYIALGYKITDMNDKVVAEPHNAEKEAETLKAQVTDLEAKLKEAVEYAENADKKIEAMEAENAKLKEAAAKTKETKQATGGSEAGKQADSGKQATK